jgi:hypothetical protein
MVTRSRASTRRSTPLTSLRRSRAGTCSLSATVHLCYALPDVPGWRGGGACWSAPGLMRSRDADQEAHFSLSDDPGYQGGVRDSFLLGWIWAWTPKGASGIPSYWGLMGSVRPPMSRSSEYERPGRGDDQFECHHPAEGFALDITTSRSSSPAHHRQASTVNGVERSHPSPNRDVRLGSCTR